MEFLKSMVIGALIASMAHMAYALEEKNQDTVIFLGCDYKMATKFSESCVYWTIEIVKRRGKYIMDNLEMEELRHRNMPKEGLSLVIKDRIGQPNLYYLVLPKKLVVYSNCEIGSCTSKREITGDCCE